MTDRSPNRWWVAAAVILPTVLEILDTTVVNVALPHIQGSLSAGVDEVSWVLTSYLIANGIVIPLTGWLSGGFGRKRFFLLCIVLFTLSSFLCGMAPDLTSLVLFRLVQGASGAAMVPLSQAILMETFPVEEQGMAMALWGIGVMFGPIAGPVLGGWITDTWSWRWAFFINIPIGLIAVLLTATFVRDPSYIRKERRVTDALGLGLLIVGLGFFQYVLDRGDRADWFEATWVWVACGISVVALTSLVFWELHHPAPILDFRLLRNRTYTMGIILNMLLGFGTYSTVMLQPLFAQTLIGYDAVSAGLVLAPGGFGTLITMLLIGAVMNRIDTRWLIAGGITLTSYGIIMMSHWNLDVGMWQMILPRLVWGLGMGLFFVPISTVSLSVFENEKMGDASALFNLMRNLGATIGITTVVTLLHQRTQFHQSVLVSHLTPNDPETSRFLTSAWQGLVSSGSDVVTAKAQASHLLYAEVQRQALLMGFMDSFWLVGTLSLVCVPLVLLISRFKGEMTVGH